MLMKVNDHGFIKADEWVTKMPPLSIFIYLCNMTDAHFTYQAHMNL